MCLKWKIHLRSSFECDEVGFVQLGVLTPEVSEQLIVHQKNRSDVPTSNQ